MALNEPSFTFGIEEEYHLVDVATRALAPAPAGLMTACEQALGRRVSPEFLRTQIEIGTGVCRSFDEARAELAHLRTTLATLAARDGLAIIASGTHPMGHGGAVETTDRDRYHALASDLAGVGRRLIICGMHVHVGIDDDALRIDLLNQARYFVAHLLILSTSSPFFDGEDTGLKSYRSAIKDAMPRTGLPGRFESHAEYQQTVDVLVKTGIIEDGSKIWWDLRPSTRFPTLELRATDVCPRLDDAIAIAALFVCLCRMLYRLRRSNQSWRQYPVFLLEENRWRAQRYGVGGSLIDLGSSELVAFSHLVEEIITLVGEDAAALGCTAQVAHARTIVANGTSADRQLAVYKEEMAAGGTHDSALRSVVDTLIAETADVG